MKIAYYIDSVPFTRDVIAGVASLGGSESACLGLARALQARGHSVHIFATKLDEDCQGADHAGVFWHPAEHVYDMAHVAEWDVFCALRMPYVFQQHIKARLRVLWNQDLLIGEPAKLQVMALAWAYDKVVYVSEYHRKQWEGIVPELKALGHVTKNGFDPALVPTDVVKKPNRIIHVTRPERGLRPLLAMWPKLKALVPDAELHLCRYNSMYDAGGWGKICAAYDQEVQRVNAEVGGITYLGELGKADLYRAIAEAAVMWYPGVADFAETSCVAAIEAQACGTPFVGSWKGALPETVPYGWLTDGDADSPAYQKKSIDDVAWLLSHTVDADYDYERCVRDGLRHVQSYAYDAIAQDWEQWIGAEFEQRSSTQALGVLRQLLHYDDHTAAMVQAEAMEDRDIDVGRASLPEATAAYEFCERVIAGREHTSEQYAAHALPDPIEEFDLSERFQQVSDWFADRKYVLDVACGNGAFAIGLARKYPDIRVVGIDYAQGNIDKAREAAERVGVADRVRFECLPVWNFQSQAMHAEWWGFLQGEHLQVGTRTWFDAIFCGEFLEHVADAAALVDGVESAAAQDALVAFTVPNGPFGEMLERGIPVHKGHVHHFTQDDLTEVFGQKHNLQATHLTMGATARGSVVGHWLVRYDAHKGGSARSRNYAERIKTTRPKAKLSVGLIVKNVEHDLGRCLEAVWPIADEIIIGDTGCTDGTLEVAAKFGARVIQIPSVQDDPDGFAGARNKVLAASTGDYFLWIDADEVLVGAQALWKYLEGGAFNGYAIPQNHLMLDSPNTADKPVRLFRRLPAIQFYGCIHEQPQMGDCNTDISPALEIGDVQIVHTGYMTEDVRRWKMRFRNLPLLQRDMARFPDRRLGKVLVLRDLVNLGDYSREMHGGQLTAEAKSYYAQAIGLFEKYFDDPGDKFYALARPWYEIALKSGIAGAYEFEFALSGKQHGMGTAKAKVERFWVRSAMDMEKVVTHRLKQIREKSTPDPVDVDPIEQPKGVAA